MLVPGLNRVIFFEMGLLKTVLPIRSCSCIEMRWDKDKIVFFIA
jgi:hypothetical protein